MSIIISQNNAERKAAGKLEVNSSDAIYTPNALSDWNSSADPGDVDNALDQLAARVKVVEGSTTTPDASGVTYTPSTLANWNMLTDPGDVNDALDELVNRLRSIETSGINASIISYTPGTLANWNSSTDPGDVDNALDQLASRITAIVSDDKKVLSSGTDSVSGYLYDKLEAGSNITLSVSGASNKKVRIDSSSSSDASGITYTPTTSADWNSSTDPGDVDNALDQLVNRIKNIETNGLSAAIVTYAPSTLSNWNSSADPGDVDNALDQLSARIRTIETFSGPVPDASGITYTPSTTANWNSSTDPGDVDNALDQLVSRVKVIETSGLDAGIITYTPTTSADWNSSADPGDVDNALDQLVSRVKIVEGQTVSYTPATLANWNSSADPGALYQGVDQLAARIKTLEDSGGLGSVDSSIVTYTPASLFNWNSSADPGDVDNALDQLASRVKNQSGAGYIAYDTTSAGTWRVGTSGNVDAALTAVMTDVYYNIFTNTYGSSAQEYQGRKLWSNFAAKVVFESFTVSNPSTSGEVQISVNSPLIVTDLPDNARYVRYIGSDNTNWNSDSPPYELNLAVDQLADRLKTVETTPTISDAADVTYTPLTATDWTGDTDPGDVDNALDQLSSRVKILETTPAISDASDITYIPAAVTDWNSDTDPGDLDEALDQLAARVKVVEGSTSAPDASITTYTPSTLTDWDANTDPGDVDNALDQLSSRTKVLETPVYTRFDVFAPPVTTHANDDEFNDNTFDTGKWSIFNYTSDTVNVTENELGLNLSCNFSDIETYVGIFQTAPVGNFTFDTYFSVSSPSAFFRVGLAFFSDATNISGVHHIGGIWGDGAYINSSYEFWTSYNTWGATMGGMGASADNCGFYRFRWNGTHLSFDISKDGISYLVRGETETFHSPMHVGFLISCASSPNFLKANIRYARFTTNTTYDIPTYGRNIVYRI